MKEKINLLDVIPVRNETIVTEKNAEGLCVLGLPRFKNKWMQKHLIPKSISPYVRVTLEEHGTAVWNLIDGKRCVRDIIALLNTHFKQEEEYEARVTDFITRLHKDQLIKYRVGV